MKDGVVSILSPFVSFSETILGRFHGGDPVVVGGEVISISTFPSLGEEYPGKPGKMIPEFQVVELDDGIGLLSLMIPLPKPELVESFQVGDIILARGYLYDERRSLKQVDVMAWFVRVWRPEGGFGDVFHSLARPQ